MTSKTGSRQAAEANRTYFERFKGAGPGLVFDFLAISGGVHLISLGRKPFLRNNNSISRSVAALHPSAFPKMAAVARFRL